MKTLCFVLIIAIFVVSGYARFTFNKGFKLPWSHLVSNNLISNNRFQSDNSDPKFKEGVVNWLKDQLDAELVKAYYGLSLNDRACIQTSLIMVQDKLDEKRPEAAMEFIENYCPSASSASEKIYDGLHEISKKMGNWSENFLDDMPDSIRVAAEKVNKYSKLVVSETDEDKKNENMIEYLNGFEDILKAPVADRENFTSKQAFLAPYLTGNLYNDSLTIVQTMKQIIKSAKAQNIVEFLNGKDKFLKAFKNLVDKTKAQLLAYFESRQRPENKLPADIDRQFTEDTRALYDMIYNTVVAPFAMLYELSTLSSSK